MNYKNILIACAGVILLSISSITSANAISANKLEEKITNCLLNSDSFKIELAEKNISGNFINLTFKLYDNNPLPLTVDVMFNNQINPDMAYYASPGSGLSVKTNFMTPSDHNFAMDVVNRKYLFIGITPREESAPADFDASKMNDWGLEQHTDDFGKVINLFQKFLDMDYEVGGHSIGAVNAWNFASRKGNKDNHFAGVRNIDMITRYATDSVESTNSLSTSSALNVLRQQGYYANPEMAMFKGMAALAQIDPLGDSGFPRMILPGNFTNKGLFGFSLIYTNQLPGAATEITGLASSWYYKQGFLAGEYNFDIDPQNDAFSLTNTLESTVYSAIDKINSGIYPVKYEEDIANVQGGNYPLNWRNIKVKSYLVNTELGMGQTDCSMMPNVAVCDTVSFFGHADPVFAEDTSEFMNKLFPDRPYQPYSNQHRHKK